MQECRSIEEKRKETPLFIRPAREDDLKIILEIYAKARQFMRESGNPNQWGEIHPLRELIEEDIRLKRSYLCEKDGMPVGVFALIIGEDPTYAEIEGGEWGSDKPYGTIHRLAGNGGAQGVAYACFEYCRRQILHLRIDTHEDNKIMQRKILDFGFQYCGIIYVRDRSPRLAYEYMDQEI